MEDADIEEIVHAEEDIIIMEEEDTMDGHMDLDMEDVIEIVIAMEYVVNFIRIIEI